MSPTTTRKLFLQALCMPAPDEDCNFGQEMEELREMNQRNVAATAANT